MNAPQRGSDQNGVETARTAPIIGAAHIAASVGGVETEESVASIERSCDSGHEAVQCGHAQEPRTLWCPAPRGCWQTSTAGNSTCTGLRGIRGGRFQTRAALLEPSADGSHETGHDPGQIVRIANNHRSRPMGIRCLVRLGGARLRHERQAQAIFAHLGRPPGSAVHSKRFVRKPACECAILPDGLTAAPRGSRTASGVDAGGRRALEHGRLVCCPLAWTAAARETARRSSSASLSSSACIDTAQHPPPGGCRHFSVQALTDSSICCFHPAERGCPVRSVIGQSSRGKCGERATTCLEKQLVRFPCGNKNLV